MSKKIRKFALVGTSSAGKTTLIKMLEHALKKNSKKTIFVQEAARYYFTKHKVNDPFSYEIQRKIQTLALKFEKEAEKRNPDIIISDRSVLDAVAYVRSQGKKNEWQELLNRVRNWLKTYNHLFLMDPKDIKHRTDEIRTEKANLRDNFHVSFAKLLSELSIPYTLISGNKNKRLKTMLGIITKS